MITTPTVSGKPGQAPTGVSRDLYPLIGSHSTWTDPRGPVTGPGPSRGSAGRDRHQLRDVHADRDQAHQALVLPGRPTRPRDCGTAREAAGDRSPLLLLLLGSPPPVAVAGRGRLSLEAAIAGSLAHVLAVTPAVEVSLDALMDRLPRPSPGPHGPRSRRSLAGRQSCSESHRTASPARTSPGPRRSRRHRLAQLSTDVQHLRHTAASRDRGIERSLRLLPRELTMRVMPGTARTKTCVECFRVVSVNSDGRLRAHKNVSKGGRCRGVGSKMATATKGKRGSVQTTSGGFRD